jgi:23S rRNA (uracil1939-C5)-methyltransferase
MGADELEVAVTALAAGGDGVARDANGRVTFIPRTAPGDRVKARVEHATSSFARAQLVEVLTPSHHRVEPPCVHFTEGCGGCQWQHVAREGQLSAKQALVTGALRAFAALTLHPIEAPAPALGWRRRARFHVARGKVGLYVHGSRRVLPIKQCPQLEGSLEAALALVAKSSPPDGELALVRGHDGAIAIGTERPWGGAARVIGKLGIVGVMAAHVKHGEPVVEVEPGVKAGPWDFAQASEAGNAVLIARARQALGTGPGTLLELHAGSGNFTRGFVADGWTVTATDVVEPAGRVAGAKFELGAADVVLSRVTGPFDAIVLDPPRVGAPEAIDGILRHAPKTIVYISCDAATLARDASRLVQAGYRPTDAWPLDLMPQTSHVEVVMRFASSANR